MKLAINISYYPYLSTFSLSTFIFSFLTFLLRFLTFLLRFRTFPLLSVKIVAANSLMKLTIMITYMFTWDTPFPAHTHNVTCPFLHRRGWNYTAGSHMTLIALQVKQRFSKIMFVKITINNFDETL